MLIFLLFYLQNATDKAHLLQGEMSLAHLANNRRLPRAVNRPAHDQSDQSVSKSAVPPAPSARSLPPTACWESAILLLLPARCHQLNAGSLSALLLLPARCHQLNAGSLSLYSFCPLAATSRLLGACQLYSFCPLAATSRLLGACRSTLFAHLRPPAVNRTPASPRKPPPRS